MCKVQAGAVTGTIAAFVEGPIDFYKSQIQVQIIRSRADPNYKRTHACALSQAFTVCHVNAMFTVLYMLDVMPLYHSMLLVVLRLVVSAIENCYCGIT